MKLKIILVFILLSNAIIAQEKASYSDEIWTNVTAFRGSIGAQKSFFTEVGISKFYYSNNGYFPVSKAKFIAVEFSPTLKPKDENDIYGLKVGYEFTAIIISVALEAKYQTDFTNNDFVITPKIGFGAFGIFTFYYGLNVSTNNKPFSRIGTHQFSIICNLNKSALEEMLHL